MRVIGVPILEEFIPGHREVEKPVQAWLAEARNATWETPHELKEQYGNASILGAGRVVFNLKGSLDIPERTFTDIVSGQRVTQPAFIQGVDPMFPLPTDFVLRVRIR